MTDEQSREGFRRSHAVVAIDVGGTKIAGALVAYGSDAAPRVLSAQSVATEAQQGGEYVMERIFDLVRMVLERACDTHGMVPQIMGIGVGTAGCVNPHDGSISSAAEGIMPGWTGMPVASRLTERFSLPVRVLGDVQAHALGEARWGAAAGCSLCMMVAPGTGLGGGIIVDGHVLRGAHGMAGEIGHTIHPAAADMTCACGEMGHAESVTSGLGIAMRYQGVGAMDPLFDRSIDGAEVSRRAAAGDRKALSVLHDAGFALGQAMGSWANTIDPERFILAGSVCKAGPVWRDALDEGYASQALPPVRAVPIVPAQLGSDAPLIGAAENLLDGIDQRL